MFISFYISLFQKSAVVSVKDKMKGEVPVGFISLKNDIQPSEY